MCSRSDKDDLHDRVLRYVLEPLRKGPDFALYRGWQHGNQSPALVVGLTTERPSPRGFRRLHHECLLAAELDASWAAKPLALIRHERQTVLILKDLGGEPPDPALKRGKGRPLDLTSFLLQACMRVAGCNCHKSKL
jgi:hypothetical protein